MGFTLVNFNSSRNTDEPFVLATWAIQAFHVAEPRDLFNMEDNVTVDDGELCVANKSHSSQRLEQLPNFDNATLV